MKRLAAIVVATTVAILAILLLLAWFTPAAKAAGCVATKGRGTVCRPTIRPTCWPTRRGQCA